MIGAGTMEFCRWYWRKLGPHQFLKISAWLSLVAASIAINLKNHESDLHDLLGLVESPFFILSIVILLASYVDLDYMEFKIERECSPKPSALSTQSIFWRLFRFFMSQISRQRTIPAQYKELFGTDLYLMLWRCRFTFMVSFCIGAVQFLSERWR
jgi:hypothetical protein